MRIAFISVSLALAAALGGCGNPQVAASLSGLCSPDPNKEAVFVDPGFAVRGATNKDQTWISETQEAGIRVCGWKRPEKPKAPKRHFFRKKVAAPPPAPVRYEPPPQPTPFDQPQTQTPDAPKSGGINQKIKDLNLHLKKLEGRDSQ